MPLPDGSLAPTSNLDLQVIHHMNWTELSHLLTLSLTLKMRTGAYSLHLLSRRRLCHCCQCQHLDASLQRAQYTANTILQLQKLLYLLEACLAHNITRWTLSSTACSTLKKLADSSIHGWWSVHAPSIARIAYRAAAKRPLPHGLHLTVTLPLITLFRSCQLDHVRNFDNFSKSGLTVMSP